MNVGLCVPSYTTKRQASASSGHDCEAPIPAIARTAEERLIVAVSGLSARGYQSRISGRSGVPKLTPCRAVNLF